MTEHPGTEHPGTDDPGPYGNPYGVAPPFLRPQPRPPGDAPPSLPPPYPGGPTAAARPVAVVVGAVVSIVLSAIVALLSVVMVAVGLSDGAAGELGLWGEGRTFFVYLYAMLGVIGLAAVVSAALALRRLQGARVVLLVLGTMAVAIEVLMTVNTVLNGEPAATALVLLYLTGTVVALALLLGRRARTWYATRPARGQVVVPFDLRPPGGRSLT